MEFSSVMKKRANGNLQLKSPIRNNLVRIRVEKDGGVCEFRKNNETLSKSEGKYRSLSSVVFPFYTASVLIKKIPGKTR